MSYADIVFATVPDAPPTWKKRRATSCPAPISAKVPYFSASKLIWNAFLFVPTSISAFIRGQDVDKSRLLNLRLNVAGTQVLGRSLESRGWLGDRDGSRLIRENACCLLA